jgi:hypothetical protein
MLQLIEIQLLPNILYKTRTDEKKLRFIIYPGLSLFYRYFGPEFHKFIASHTGLNSEPVWLVFYFK